MALFSKKRWIEENVTPVEKINQSDAFAYGMGAATVSSMLGTANRAARTREQIYEKFATMEGDPIIAAGIKILCTTALGGDPQTGKMIFLEKTTEANTDKRLAKIADEIADDLSDLFNKIAYTTLFTGCCYGDAYTRIYSEEKAGIVELSTDELFKPQMVQPFEQGGKTQGYLVYCGKNFSERLSTLQMARLKMPRTQWTPQPAIVQKSMKMAITEDDLANLPLMPAMVGGSFLYAAEPAWEYLVAALSGLSGQRLTDLVDEAYLTLNMEGMTDAQQKKSAASLVEMLTKTKTLINDSIANRKPLLGRIRHVIPVYNEKQMTNITPMQASRSSVINTDDVMLYARLLAGSIGVDLSLLGFADQITSVFGDGGMARVSSQLGEQSRFIRMAGIEFYDHLIDIHTLKKYGIVYPKNQRPVKVNFYGSISAFESELQRTKADAINTGMLLSQVFAGIKETGLKKPAMVQFFTKQMLIDEEEAEMYAEDLCNAQQQQGQDFSGGGDASNADGEE